MVKFDPAEGDPFNPNDHMALFNVPKGEKEAGTVAAVTRWGTNSMIGYPPAESACSELSLPFSILCHVRFSLIITSLDRRRRPVGNSRCFDRSVITQCR